MLAEQNARNLEKVIWRLREKVSEFCLDRCSGECCRWGYNIDVSEKEAGAIFGVLDVGGIEDSRLDYSCEGEFELVLGPCPALVSVNGRHKCGIHSDSDRPKGCRDYPIFVEDKKVLFDNRCSAICSGEFRDEIGLLEYYGAMVEIKK